MASYAQVTLVGTIGQDPIQKQVGSTTVVECSMAVNHKQGDVEIVNWYRLAFWGKVGETAMKYLKKGKQHMVSGQQVVREFVKADGTPGYGVQVSVDRLVLLGGGDGNGQASLAPVAAPQGSGAAVADADLPF